MFQKFNNLERSFQHIRTFSICFFAGNLLLLAFGIYQFTTLIEHKDQRIYILQGDQVLHAEAAGRDTKLEVQLRAHVKSFHQLFFSLDPDEKVIKSNLSSALYLADASAQHEYNNLQESGYYSGIIAGNISQKIHVDSVWLDTKVSPYLFRCYATQEITRSSSKVLRSLISTGQLRPVSQSDNNPHGYLIERWSVLDNKDISTTAR